MACHKSLISCLSSSFWFRTCLVCLWRTVSRFLSKGNSFKWGGMHDPRRKIWSIPFQSLTVSWSFSSKNACQIPQASELHLLSEFLTLVVHVAYLEINHKFPCFHVYCHHRCSCFYVVLSGLVSYLIFQTFTYFPQVVSKVVEDRSFVQVSTQLPSL